MKFTKKEKHYFKYLLNKMKKIQTYRWSVQEDCNNLPYQWGLIDIDDAIQVLETELKNS